MAGGGENQHDGLIQPPSHYLEACASKLPWRFLFFFLPSHFPLHLHILLLKQLSSHHCSARSFNLLSLFYLSHPLAPTLSISSILPFPVFWPYYLCSSTSYAPRTTARPTDFAIWKLWCSSLTAYLILCFAWCPVALRKGSIPGWITGCVVLISPEWPLHHYWGWLYCLGNFTTMPLAALTPVTWSLSPQQLMKEVW